MVDKLLSVSLLATLATTGTVALSDHAEALLQEANAIAAQAQVHQLRIALELYHLEHGRYPAVADDELVDHLYAARKIEESELSYRIRYAVTPGGADYELSAHH
ncbi:MAG: type II secretion system protein GspG [Patescibacteria group bacterium]